jgi:hypothetical protein
MRAGRTTQCWLAIGCVGSIAMIGGGVLFGAQRDSELHISRPRVIAAAVREIERHFGRVITYEDTSYVHPSDIVDETEQVRRTPGADPKKRILGVRTERVDLKVPPRQPSLNGQAGEVLQALLGQSRAAGNTGEFRVDWTPGGYHVIPVSRKGKDGALEPYSSPLEARITLPQRTVDGLAFMRCLAAAITKTTGRKITAGIMPLNRLNQARIAVDAQNDSARDVLWRALQSVGPDLSWQMLCEVGEQSECALNIHMVPIR